MSLLTIINGIVIGCLLLSSLFSLILIVRRFEIRINAYYASFAVCLSAYVFFTLQNGYQTETAQFILYDKITTASLTIASIFFLYLFANLTEYKPRVIVFSLEFLLLLQLTLNFIIRNGITFSEVTGKQEAHLFWGETINYPVAQISVFFVLQIILIVLVFAFVIKAIYYMHKNGEKENWRVLLISVSIGILLVFLNTFFELFRYRGFVIVEKIGLLSFTMIVSHRNFKNLYKAGEIKKDLQKSEERLRLIQDSSNDGVWEWNLGSGESYVSTRYAEMLGYKTNELNNDVAEWFKLIHPDDLEEVQEVMKNLFQSKINFFKIRYRLKTKDGIWKWIYARGKIIEYDKDGKPIKIAGAQTDIDEQMNIQQELEESRKRYKYLSDAAFEGVGITENGIVVDCNTQLAEMLGYSLESMIGKSFMDFVAIESQKKVNSIINLNKDSDAYEHLAVRNDGKTFPVEVRVKTLTHEGKKLRVSVIRDISYKKQHEAEISDREETLREIVDSAPYGAQIYALNENGILILTGFNKSADSTLRISHSKLIGKTLTAAFPSLAITQVPAIYKRVVQEGITYKDDQTLYDGDSIIGIFEVNAIRSGKNKVTVFYRDITEKKRAEENLRASEEKFRLIAENSTDMISKHDSQGVFVYVSPSCKTLLGYDTKEIIGKGPSDFIHPEYMPKVLASLKSILEDPNKVDVTVYKIRKKYGEYVWFETVSKTVRNKQTGKVLEIHNSSREVSERIRYQQELKNNADNLNIIFDATPIPLILESLAPKVQVIYANDAACKFIGKVKNEIMGKMIVGGIPEHLTQDADGNSLPDGDVYNFETSLLVNDEVRYAIVNIKIVHYNGIKCALSAILDITERKIALDAMATSERTLSTALKIAKLGHWEYDVFQDLFTFNDEFYKMLRTTVNQVGKYKLTAAEYAQQFIPEKERDVVVVEIKKAIETADENYNNQLEHRIIFGDGALGHLTVRINVIKDDNGQTIKLYGVNQDITERKTAEEENTRRKYLIDQLLENVPDVIYFKDTESKFLEISKSFSNRLEIKDKSEIIGKTDFDIFDEKHAREAYTDELNIMKTDTPLISKVEKELWHGEDEHWALTTKMPLKNSMGEIIGTFGISRDITKSKIAEEKLRDAMHYIEYVINSIPVAILSIDDHYNLTQFNQAANSFRNNSVSDDEKKLFKMFPELKMIIEPLEKSRQTKGLVTEIVTVADDEGEAKMFSVSIFPLTMVTSAGSVIMVEDITNKRKMEQVLIQSEKMLSVAGLAAGMAHEINNPLGTISQGCQNLARRASTALPKNFEVASRLGIEMEKIESYFKERQIFEIMDSMQGAVEKASEIIKSMLQFSRRSESKKIQYSLKKIVEEVIDLAYNDYDLKKKFNFRSFKIIKEYEDLIPDVLITVTEIQQVIYNIIQNAAHAIRGEDNPGKFPELIFRLSKESKYVRLEIEDNGPGMNEKIRNRIFEPFFTTKEVGEGTGLGLSVSYMIITHNHSGLLTVDSIVGKGTKFIIQLPYLDKT